MGAATQTDSEDLRTKEAVVYESSSKTESQELPHPWTGKGGCPR